jgi:hypothetical protein
MADPDGLDTYYAERLWQLLPAVYRTEDTDAYASPGPLRELLNRIGAQVAVVRRSMDRLWADQSIETCDDWVIPYIGDLLGTNLVTGPDVRGQRLDVAKTIHYRRRKGTLEVLEELARDVTGWDAHVVEGFRRLARSRHGLDPALGPGSFPGASPADVAQLLSTEGLLGTLTQGPAGGLADLRNAHGATLADGPFDESFHMADLRRGQGALGHFGIPRLAVFLWRLTSFQVVAGTPVAVQGCATPQYAFDPTGREVPLFLPPAPDPGNFATVWTSAPEWQVPGPLSSSLLAAIAGAGPTAPLQAPYPNAALVPPAYGVQGSGGPLAPVSVWPELGRFALAAAAAVPAGVNYCYGFPARIGAGPYDRALLANPPVAPGPETIVEGGSGLGTALGAAPARATVSIADSLTYPGVADVGSNASPIASLLVRASRVAVAGSGTTSWPRPVIRPAPGSAPWVFTGSGQATLTLDGLLVSGCDLIFRGSFDTVRITACTMDPGSAAPGSPPLASAVDGQVLAPTTIWIEADPAAPAGTTGAIRSLMIDHCILGPVRTRLGGALETLTITDSIVQGIPATATSTYALGDVFDPARLAAGLLADDPLSAFLASKLPATAIGALGSYRSPEPLPQAVLDGLNALVAGTSLYDPVRFAGVALSLQTRALVARIPSLDAAGLARLNRSLLDEAYPLALGVGALAVDSSAVTLARVSVLGRCVVHRLVASDSILDEFAVVEDSQDGCVRFSATADGSRVPRQYESATIAPGAPIFTSTNYGAPGYGQLLESSDDAILAGSKATSVLAGAENSSEMGAFSAGLAPIKEAGLLIKYAEYMPLGLTPVVVHVT